VLLTYVAIVDCLSAIFHCLDEWRDQGLDIFSFGGHYGIGCFVIENISVVLLADSDVLVYSLVVFSALILSSGHQEGTVAALP